MRGPKVKERKREEAEARQAIRDGIGDGGQLSKLIKAGHGHTREAKRLLKRIRKRKKTDEMEPIDYVDCDPSALGGPG